MPEPINHDKHAALLTFVDEVNGLLDALGRRVALADLDARGRVQHAIRERANVVGERGREQQVLPLCRQEADDAPDVGQEAHVEHAIGFVEHEDLDVREIDRALLSVVEQASGCGDDDVDAAPELRDLRVDADAAEDHGGAQRHVLAVVAHALADLRGELARRRQDQRTNVPAVTGRRVVGGEPVQQRQGEAGRLAGAGLSAGHDVASCEHDGNDLRLDGGGGGIALF